MIEPEPERLEESLRRISPAPAPAELLTRLRAAVEPPVAARPAPRLRLADWLRSWRALVLAGPAVAAVLLLCLFPASRLASQPADGIKANDVQVGHSLVASFDEVAQLPGAEPVRLRYREWQDEVVIRDAARGVVFSQITPRIEVIPVRFETY